ncbi:zinc finger MYM-type protein 1 [Citrus clementina]|uniref:zinc finger MYM-type protein 1 n=1 Tax=Citrus clementina TaxID=85681 RepID=UPI000CED4ADC|nr:zinc finger MYM-type protein 1 [Citrus x clementina]
MNQKQHIATFFGRQSEKTQSEYETRLNAVVDCIRFLLNQGLAFRGYDESDGSSNRGNFLELLHFLADHNEDINAVTFKNTPLNLQMMSPNIQKHIVSCVATETTNAIIREMDGTLFSILIDESRDISTKEQMVVVLRYVDKNGYMVERFVGIEHVSSTTAASLKESLDNMFSRFGLSLSMLRGQGYDGASNMQGEFNGLKTLILEENESAYYVHCFALQLALISMAKKHEKVNSLFNLVSMLVNVVGVSAKRRDILHEKHALAVIEALGKGELSSGQAFDKEKLLRLAEFYPKDFSAIDLIALEMQLDVYITDLRSSAEFSELKGIGELARTMVKTKKDKVYPLVYQLVTLALILPVPTATVERVFSAMNFVKNRL